MKKYVPTILLAIFLIGISFLMFNNYEKFIDKKDFVILSESDCDPQEHNCFIYSDNTCSLDGGCDIENTTFYKKSYEKAYKLFDCDPYLSNSCPQIQCTESSNTCEEVFCSPETLEDGEFCSADIR